MTTLDEIRIRIQYMDLRASGFVCELTRTELLQYVDHPEFLLEAFPDRNFSTLPEADRFKAMADARDHMLAVIDEITRYRSRR